MAALSRKSGVFCANYAWRDLFHVCIDPRVSQILYCAKSAIKRAYWLQRSCKFGGSTQCRTSSTMKFQFTDGVSMNHYNKTAGIALVLGIAVIGLNGCASSNQALAKRTTTVEYLRVFDLVTDASASTIGKAAADGLARNVNRVNSSSTPQPRGELPEKPATLQIGNPLAGSKIAALMAASGQAAGLRVASCEGAVWTGNANRTIRGTSDLRLTVCVFPYKGGYHLDMHGIFVKEEGGVFQISRDAAAAMIGTPEEWTEKTFMDVVRNIKASIKTDIKLVEAQPDVIGTPWLEPLGIK
jgi:hypothetical protein